MATIGSAGVTRTGGYTNYASNNTTNNYIPVLFAKKMLRNFYAESCYQLICNTDYEGQIKQVGDSVIIRKAPTLSIREYEVGGTITYDVPTSTAVELNIDTAKVWAFKLDDIDELQSDMALLNAFTTAAAQQLEVTIDQDVLSVWSAGAAAANKGTTAGALTGMINLGTAGAGTGVAISGGESGTSIDFILDAAQTLDEQNIPDQGRFIVLPSWYIQKLKSGILRRADVTGDGTSAMRSGVVGMIDKFLVIRSNNLPWDATNKNSTVIFGNKEACTFAMQLTKNESLRIQNSFGEYVRGLAVYGKGVVQPTALGVGIVHNG